MPLEGRDQHVDPALGRLRREAQLPAEMRAVDLLRRQGSGHAVEATEQLPVRDLAELTRVALDVGALVSGVKVGDEVLLEGLDLRKAAAPESLRERT